MEHLTCRAFIENLSEAAVNTRSLDICEILLDVGARPDQLITEWNSDRMQRPIQLAVDYSGDSTAFTRLRTRFGFQVDLIRDDGPETALLRAAKCGGFETARNLVETLILSDSKNYISHVTALAKIAEAACTAALSYQGQVELDERLELSGLARPKIPPTAIR